MARAVTVLDGGMGRELLRIGAPFRQPEWSALALLEGPEWVVRAHRNFVEAGARVVTTNTYALVPFHIGEECFRADGHRLASLAGRLARDAVLEAGLGAGDGDGVDIAGSLPPLFGSYRPDLFDAALAPALIDPLVDALAEHVDIWLGETLGSIAEATAVRDALDRIGDDRPLWLSFALEDGPAARLRSGETAEEAARAAADLGAAAVLFNCSQAEAIGTAIASVTATLPDVRTGGYANRFSTGHTDDGSANDQLSTFRDDLDPQEYRRVVAGWIELGADIVGGCCGMGPEHIAELAHLAGGGR